MSSVIAYAIGSSVSAIITALALLYNTRWQNRREPAREAREQQRQVYVAFLIAVELFLHDWPMTVVAENEAHEAGEPFNTEEHLDLDAGLVRLRDAERLMALTASPSTQRYAATLTGDFITFIRGIDPEQPIYMRETLRKGWDTYELLVASMRHDLGIGGGAVPGMITRTFALDE